MPAIVSICPICGGDVVVKEVEKIIKGGDDALFLKVQAGVCLKCGERIYDKETQEEFQRLRKALAERKLEDVERVGNTYRMEKEIIMRHFTVVLEPEEEGGYHVYCPALKGCHSYGETREEALKNIREAIQLWIEAAREHGIPIPEMETVEVAFP